MCCFDVFKECLIYFERNRLTRMGGAGGSPKKALKQILNILKPTLPPIKCLAKLVQTAFSAQPIFLSLPLSQDFGKITLLEYIRINILTCYLTFSLSHILTFYLASSVA